LDVASALALVQEETLESNKKRIVGDMSLHSSRWLINLLFHYLFHPILTNHLALPLKINVPVRQFEFLLLRTRSRHCSNTKD
jgi:hypothetical protein